MEKRLSFNAEKDGKRALGNRKLRTQDMVLCGVFTTLIAVGAFIKEIGAEQYLRFLEIRRCDIEAQNPDLIASRMVKVNKLQQIGREILGQGRVA